MEGRHEGHDFLAQEVLGQGVLVDGGLDVGVVVDDGDIGRWISQRKATSQPEAFQLKRWRFGMLVRERSR